MRLSALMPDALQELLNRGWRRSGCWLYKPDLRETCCPPYTIRLDVHRFQPKKARQTKHESASNIADPAFTAQ